MARSILSSCKRYFIYRSLSSAHWLSFSLILKPCLPRRRGCTLAAALAFVAYLLNQRYGSGDALMYETESVITMVLGLWMVNVVFSFGHRLLNFQSARVTYFVNASLFIYLVHHPLTLFFGAYITPHITSNWLGFLCGLIFVVGIAIILYEIHLRIPLLKFLFLVNRLLSVIR